MITLMVVLGVAVLAGCLLQLSVSATRNHVHAVEKKRAFYLAEAGVSEAIYGLMVGETGNVASAAVPAMFGDGLLWVQATEGADGRVSLESTGLYRGARSALSIVVERGAEPVAALGIFSDGDLTVHSGSVIDTFDSTSKQKKDVPAPDEILEAAGAACIGSNGNIDIQGTSGRRTHIGGDVTPGQHGSVTSGEGVTIAGSTAPRSQRVELPAIEVPALISAGVLEHKSSKTLKLAAGEHRYDSLTVASGSKLVILGPQTLVVGSLVVERDAELILDATGGPVRIYVTDHVNLAAGSTVESDLRDPTQVSIMISASETTDRNGDGVAEPPVSIQASGELYGTIYAPSAAITLSRSFELYGAITAASLVLSENAQVHFDRALLSSAGAGPQDVKLVSWRVMELPETPLVKSLIDPIAALKLQGVVLAAPSNAHHQKDFMIIFTDARGKNRVWKGEEASFDWSLVQSVVKIKRKGDLDFDDDDDDD